MNNEKKSSNGLFSIILAPITGLIALIKYIYNRVLDLLGYKKSDGIKYGGAPLSTSDINQGNGLAFNDRSPKESMDSMVSEFKVKVNNIMKNKNMDLSELSDALIPTLREFVQKLPEKEFDDLRADIGELEKVSNNKRLSEYQRGVGIIEICNNLLVKIANFGKETEYPHRR